MKRTVFFVGLLVSAAVLSACTQPASTNTPDDQMNARMEQTQPMNDPATSQMVGSPLPQGDATGAAEAGEVRTISVEAGSFYYEPSVIRVQKGERVRIEMKSVDMMHDFVIAELDVNIPVTRSGETNSVEFTADQVGEFEYFCSVGSHRAQGQVGALIVEE